MWMCQWPCNRNRLIGGSYHISEAYFSRLFFRGYTMIYPHFIWSSFGTNVPPFYRILFYSHWMCFLFVSWAVGGCEIGPLRIRGKMAEGGVVGWVMMGRCACQGLWTTMNYTIFGIYIYYIYMYVCFLAEWTFINPRYCCCEQQSGFPWFPYESARYSFPGRLVWKPRYKRLSLKITGWWFKTLFYLSISYGNVILPVENHILWKPLIYWYMETIYWNLPLVVFILFKMVIAPPTRYNWHK